MKRLDVIGQSRDQIERLTHNLRRADLLDLLARAVSLETFFSAAEIATARRMTKRAVLEAMKKGELRAHKPTPYRWVASLGDIRAWDQQTAVRLT